MHNEIKTKAIKAIIKVFAIFLSFKSITQWCVATINLVCSAFTLFYLNPFTSYYINIYGGKING